MISVLFGLMNALRFSTIRLSRKVHYRFEATTFILEDQYPWIMQQTETRSPSLAVVLEPTRAKAQQRKSAWNGRVW